MACEALGDLCPPSLSPHLSSASATLPLLQAHCLRPFALSISFAWNVLPAALYMAHIFSSLQLKCYLYQKSDSLLITFHQTTHLSRSKALPSALCSPSLWSCLKPGLVTDFLSCYRTDMASMLLCLSIAISLTFRLFTTWTLLTSPTSSPGVPYKMLPKLQQTP